MHVVKDSSNKAVTIISTDGSQNITVSATTFLNMSVRKDGGVTLWADGRPKSETIRVDSRGMLKAKRIPVGSKVRKPPAVRKRK
jgi:hypothetical protein